MSDKIKYDENYKCYYSLDHKSKIIYIKPSPSLLSSIFNSKIISKKTTKNISNEESVKSSLTPRKEKEGTVNQEGGEMSGKIVKNNPYALNFDHNVIIEKLKNLEISRKNKDLDQNSKNVIYSSENEEEEEN